MSKWPKFRGNSKAPAIIKAWHDGVTSPTKIGRIVGSTPQNVVKALHRHVPEYRPRVKRQEFGIQLLTPDAMEWLDVEAKRNGVSVGEMARALLIDGIDMARGEKSE